LACLLKHKKNQIIFEKKNQDEISINSSDEENNFLDDEDQDELDILSESDTEDYSFGSNSFTNKLNLPKAIDPEIKKREEIYHKLNNSCFSDSDIDLFIYGLNEEEASKKIIEIYNFFKKNLKNINLEKYGINVNNFINVSGIKENIDDIFILRSKNSITFHFQYPIRLKN